MIFQWFYNALNLPNDGVVAETPFVGTLSLVEGVRGAGEIAKGTVGIQPAAPRNRISAHTSGSLFSKIEIR